MTESELIDEILNFHNSSGPHNVQHIEPQNKQLYFKAYERINAYGLITTPDKYGCTFLSKTGYEVIAAGGFDKWLSGIEQKADELHRAAITTANATADASVSAKHSKYAAWVAAGGAVVAGLFPLYQQFKPAPITGKSDSTVNALTRRVDTIYLQLKDLKQVQKSKAAPEQKRKIH